MLIWYLDNIICTALEYINIRFYEYFCLVSQRVQMHFYIFRQCTYIVFILQYQNTKTNCQTLQKKTRYNVVLIVFDGVPCDVSVYTVTVSYRCTVRIAYQKKLYFGLWWQYSCIAKNCILVYDDTIHV